MEIKGKFVAFGLVALTGIVGALFVLLGPKAIEKNPGILHVGVRYLDEMTISFAHHPSGGPGASIAFVAADGELAYRFEPLRTGRNLVPIEPDQLPSGPYTARLSAPGYETVELPVRIERRMLNPAPDAELPPHSHVDYNMIGVRFQPQAHDAESADAIRGKIAP